MTLPSWIKNNTWQWIIGTIIAIAAITVPLVLTRPSDPPHKISTIDGDDNIQVVDSPGAKIIKTGTSPEDRQRQETTLENTEQIIRLLEEKGYDANPQFVSELKDKIQKLEKELEERTRTTEDKRAEEALIASKAGNYEKARKLFEALRKEEREKEAEHAKTAYNLGNVYFVELDFPKALNAYLDSVRLAPDDSIYLHEVGNAYSILAQYDKAIEYYEKALKPNLNTLGENHLNVAIIWNTLGLAWCAKGDYDKSIEYYEKALKSDLNTFGEDHPNVATYWNNLGAAWYAKGDYNKSIEYYEKALKSGLNTFGEDHPRVATYWNNLGVAWGEKGDYDKSIEYYEKALKSDLNTFGEEHPRVATSWNNLGEAWLAKSEYNKAIEYLEKALKSFKKAGHHHAKRVEDTLKSIRER